MNSKAEKDGDFNRSLYPVTESHLETTDKGVTLARAALAKAREKARESIEAQEKALKAAQEAQKAIEQAIQAEAEQALGSNPS